jgi:hypothetical protein
MPWVVVEIAAMALGTMQFNIFAWNQKLAKYEKLGAFGVVELVCTFNEGGVVGTFSRE